MVSWSVIVTKSMPRALARSYSSSGVSFGEKVTSRRPGTASTEKQEWTSDGDPDHYALATVYFRMAVNRFENFIDWDEPVKTTAAATVEPDFDPEAVIMAEKVEDYDWYYGPN